MSQMVPWMLWGTLRSYFHPCLWAPTTHGWRNIRCLISAFRAHSLPSPSPVTEHHTGSRGIPAWVPAPPSQEVVFFSSVSPHPLLAGRASITTVRLEVIEAGDEERTPILSIEKQEKKKRSKDKHPVELREVNSRREPRFPPFPGVSIIPLRFNMHSDYFTK